METTYQYMLDIIIVLYIRFKFPVAVFELDPKAELPLSLSLQCLGRYDP